MLRIAEIRVTHLTGRLRAYTCNRAKTVIILAINLHLLETVLTGKKKTVKLSL
jgi:hypothetical protein